MQEGDLVLAYNEATGKLELHPITDTISHVDPEIVLLTIEGDPSTSAGIETLATTAEHPFYVLDTAPGWRWAKPRALGSGRRTAN